MKHGKLVAMAVCLLGLGVAAAAAAPGGVVDLSAAKIPQQEKAIGPSIARQTCPSRAPRQVVANGIGGAVLDNYFISLGVMDAGNLIYPPAGENRPEGPCGGSTGLYFDYTGNEVLASGCYCEGWGVADAITGQYGQAGDAFGWDNLVIDSFTSTATTAVSVVRVLNPSTEAGVFKVTHDFHPSVTDRLFECTVTIQNISPANVVLKYRRVLDWDMVPGCGPWELVTVKKNGSPKVTLTNNNGFADGNPLSDPMWPYEVPYTAGDFVDLGPADQGAQFNLDFGALAPNQSVMFYFYYGGGMDQIDAMTALAMVGAEAYSLAKPDPSGGSDLVNSLDGGPYAGGRPNSAVFGLKGVSGKRVAAPQSFLDDYLRSALCVAWDPGYYQWSILSGPGMYNTYVGLGQVLNGNQKIVSFPGDPESMNFTFDKLRKKAQGYFTSPEGYYSPLFDRLTTDDPPCGYRINPAKK